MGDIDIAVLKARASGCRTVVEQQTNPGRTGSKLVPNTTLAVLVSDHWVLFTFDIDTGAFKNEIRIY